MSSFIDLLQVHTSAKPQVYPVVPISQLLQLFSTLGRRGTDVLHWRPRTTSRRQIHFFRLELIQHLHELALVRLVTEVPTIVESKVLCIHAKGSGYLGHSAFAAVDLPQLPWLTKVHVAQGL